MWKSQSKLVRSSLSLGGVSGGRAGPKPPRAPWSSKAHGGISIPRVAPWVALAHAAAEHSPGTGRAAASRNTESTLFKGGSCATGTSCR